MTSIEAYLKYLDDLACKTGEYSLITAADEMPPVWIIKYKNLIEPCSLTTFTYGLSSVDHKEWTYGRPELILHVKSENIDWPITLGNVVRLFRGTCAFSYGEIIRFERRLTYDTEMSAFFVFAPSVVEQKDAAIMLPDRSINLVQLYPIYEDEIPLITNLGPTKVFMNPDTDFSDVKRRMLNT